MSPRGPVSSAEPYSPQRRTALVLTGTGTAGAYHAGVLRALHEAGVKVDVVAGRGMGALGALFAAVDGSQRLWDERGFWRSARVGRLYSWHPLLHLCVGALGVALAIVALPLAVMAVGLLVFPLDFLLKMTGLTANGLTEGDLGVSARAFSPGGLPTWLPRFAVLVLTVAGLTAVTMAWRARDARRTRGSSLWRAVPAPLTITAASEHLWATMWDLIRGAAQLGRPPAVEVGRRYAEMLSENLGQPGFRELLIAVHDLDAGRDVIFALVAEGRRLELVRRPTSAEADERRASVVDLAGLGRDHLPDALAASLSVPLATAPRAITFASDAYWRGETHRLCDRPASLARLIEELVHLDVEQFVVVSASPATAQPHGLTPARLDGRGRLGEYLQSAEAAVVRDVCLATTEAGRRVFLIAPWHNPVGPFDFAGAYDDRSDRPHPLVELMSRGYEDAYRLFIEPVVGASGDRVARKRATNVSL